MVSGISRQAYLLEVGLTQTRTYHETLFIVFHVWIHLDFSSMCGMNLDSLNLFDQGEILECNGHWPLVLWVKWPLEGYFIHD